MKKGFQISESAMLGIDLTRGVLSILVLLAHSMEAAFKGRGILPKGVYEAFVPGTYWVIGFFVLSGFCVGLSVYRGLGKGTYRAGEYLFARVTRIYPILLVGLLLAVLAWFLNRGGGEAFDWVGFVSTLFCLQRFSGEFPFYEPSWSITFEMAYYLVFPILIVACKRDIGRIWWVGVAVSIVFAGVFGALWKLGFSNASWLIPFWSIPLHGICWFGGLWLVTGWFQERWPKGNTLVALLIAGFLVSYGLRTGFILAKAPALVAKVNLIPSTLFFILLIRSADFWQLPKKFLSSSLIKNLGSLSYPLYLFHIPLQGILFFFRSELGLDDLSAPVWFAALFFFPLLISWTIGVWLEKRFLAARRNWMTQVARAN